MRSKQSVFCSVTFSKRLKQRIKELSLKQDELAERTGIGQSTISRYVNNKQVPELAPAVALAQALECDLGWLVGISGLEKKDAKDQAHSKGGAKLAPKERQLLDNALEILRAQGQGADYGDTLKQVISSLKRALEAEKRLGEG